MSHPNAYSTFKPRQQRMARKSGLRSADTAARREKRARLEDARAERPPTYTALERQLNGLVATRVKLRDGHLCQQCLADGVVLCDIIDAGHLFPRSIYPNFKFEADAIFGQCRLHNKLHIRRPDIMACWYQDAHGEEALERLSERARLAPRPTRDDLLRMIDENEREIAVLKLTRVA